MPECNGEVWLLGENVQEDTMRYFKTTKISDLNITV